MKEVIVLMSAYNGQKFIREQIDSILGLNEINPKIVIRDDGSTDKTTAIIKDFILNHKEKIELIEGKNIGWKKSFFALIEYAYTHYSSYQYFAFADQDDIWLPDKLYRAVEMLEASINIPALYCSNLFFYKEGVNYGKIRKFTPEPTYKNCLVRNYATGCTEVFNRPLLELIARKTPSISVAHDYWVYQAAVLCGEVFIDDESYILYRQHGNNQIGCKSGWLDVWKRRLSDFKHSFTSHQREEQAEQLLNILGIDMKPEGRLAVQKVAFYRKSIQSQFSLMLDKGYSLGRLSNDLWLKFRILLRIL